MIHKDKKQSVIQWKEEKMPSMDTSCHFFYFYIPSLPYSLGGISDEVNAVQQLLGSSERW